MVYLFPTSHIQAQKLQDVVRPFLRIVVDKNKTLSPNEIYDFVVLSRLCVGEAIAISDRSNELANDRPVQLKHLILVVDSQLLVILSMSNPSCWDLVFQRAKDRGTLSRQ